MRSQNELKPLFSNVSKTGLSLGDEIKRMKENFDSIVIDTGGRDSKEMRKAMLNSNIIIIPVIASQYDVSVLDHMLEIYAEVKELNENLLALLLINRSSTNPFVSKELENLQKYINEVKKEGNLTDLILLKSVIYERQAYKKAVVEGKSIKEFCKSDDKALQDFEAFYKELLQVAKEYFN